MSWAEVVAVVIMNFECDCIKENGSLVARLDRGYFPFKPKKLDLYMKHHESPPTKPSFKEAQKLKLKSLQPHLRYVLFEKGYTLQVIIASNLNMEQVECLVDVLKRFKRAIRWTIADIIGFHPVFIHTKSNSCPIISQV